MTVFHIAFVVRHLNGHTDSVQDQVNILIGMEDEGIRPPHDGIRRKQVEDVLGISLEYRPQTALGHLVELGLLERDPEEYEDLRTYVIAEWIGPDGEVVNGRVPEAAEAAIEALIQHIHDTDLPEEESGAIADGSGVSLRRVLATELNGGIVPSDVEDYLRQGDLVKNLDEAVEAIENHPAISTRDDYGRIVFRNQAYRYRLSELAVELFRL